MTDIKYEIDKESEEAFRAWLESIVFVDEDGNVLPMEEAEEDKDESSR
ncbi:MAG: hypothetical protein SRB1_00638 [Desulfobacteraceae bacterium Eth-SRB1]|nr:MAG: hypothetical protein SRB1_00638 [Desulfobacteraceae bacterium Eth-SRB1]